jgi:hypothetical protein
MTTDLHICAWCQAEFTPNTWHPGQRHCSRPCQSAALRAAKGHAPTGVPTTLTCAGCSTTFAATAGRGRPPLWCPECRQIPYHRRRWWRTVYPETSQR